MHPLSEERTAIRDQLRRFMQRELEPLTAQLESGELLPFPLIKRMVSELGLVVDDEEKPSSRTQERVRDPERDALLRFARTQLTVEIGRVNPGFLLSYGASVGLFAGNVRGKGTAEQIARYVPPVLRGEKIGCWCLTEPEAGSDALGAMRTRARRDGDGYVLDGEKTFITNAPFADCFLVYAKDDAGDAQAFLVERGTPGLSTSKPFAKMGMRSSPTGAVYLSEVRVPRESLLGGGISDRAHVRHSLASERIGLAVMGYAIAERCFEIAVQYAKTRVQGGRPIAEYQLIQQRLARMYVALSNARRIVYASDEVSALDACAGKLYVAEVGSFVAQEAIHILGGNGYMEEYVVERLARDAKLVEIGGGTTEIQILTIARHVLQDSGSR
ncbi:MAG TPA: acyl-CoA dehydrogenase family protein [Polyangiales bacterium]|nr:acyl-CoA dehydrogenase family protein [Polyangiales bacterium]